MPKVLNTAFPVFQPGPIPSSPPKYIVGFNKDQVWSAKKALTFNLKKYFYLLYVTKYKCQATTSGFYRQGPNNIGDYCKDQYEITTSSQFKVDKMSDPIKPTPNEPATIFVNMCKGEPTVYNAEITQKYRRTNSLGNGGGASNVSEIVEKKRNCNKDYDDEGNKISENPDTSFFDYTVTFPSSLNLEIYHSVFSVYLDPNDFTVLANFTFGGTYNHLIFKGSYNPDDCPKMSRAGTLVFNGKPISADVFGLGTACGSAGGTIVMNVTWTASEKFELI